MKNLLLVSIVLLTLFCACSKDGPIADNFPECEMDNPLPKGNRVLGLDLLDLTESNTFDQNIDLAKELGINFIALHLPWRFIETTPNHYVDPYNAIELLGQVAVANNLKLSLTIRPIDLTGKMVPYDLENVRFNDFEMINRFKSVVDFVFTKINSNTLLNIQIGNEIDGYNTSNESPVFWEDYGFFLHEITNYIHSINPNVKVGFTGTCYGLLQNPTRFNTLLQSVDILGVTYYPINNDFRVKEPSTVFSDLDNLSTAFDTKPIYMQEVGYPSSETNNSSEEKQANFFCNFFKAWDSHANSIKSISIVRLNNLSKQGAMDAAEPYGISDSEFIEYLRTLGLRTFDKAGTNKKAFETIKDNAVARGW
ncbi:MAG: hypothetical protein CSA95_08080 [Bacteroidetes bacterium]|nr:MAG: hypothetical protein CSA95_08080 [Bacteroidota bacterium]